MRPSMLSWRPTLRTDRTSPGTARERLAFGTRAASAGSRLRSSPMFGTALSVDAINHIWTENGRECEALPSGITRSWLADELSALL